MELPILARPRCDLSLHTLSPSYHYFDANDPDSFVQCLSSVGVCFDALI